MISVGAFDSSMTECLGAARDCVEACFDGGAVLVADQPADLARDWPRPRARAAVHELGVVLVKLTLVAHGCPGTDEAVTKEMASE